MENLNRKSKGSYKYGPAIGDVINRMLNKSDNMQEIICHVVKLLCSYSSNDVSFITDQLINIINTNNIKSLEEIEVIKKKKTTPRIILFPVRYHEQAAGE